MKNTNQIYSKTRNYFLGFIQLILTLVVLTVAAKAVAIYEVTNTNDSGFGSLRQAILNANNHGLSENRFIHFSISGSGVKTINLQSPLPTIIVKRTGCGTDDSIGVYIDATTQSGYAGAPLIEINGLNAGSAHGLKVEYGVVTVRGLAINRFVYRFGVCIECQVDNCRRHCRCRRRLPNQQRHGQFRGGRNVETDHGSGLRRNAG